MSQRDDGLRAAEAAACYLCEAPGEVLHAGLVDRFFGAPGRYDVRRCPRCGLRWLDPRPGPSEIETMYARDYFTHAPSQPARPTPNGQGPRPISLKEAVRRQVLAGSYGYSELSPEGAGRVLGRVASAIGPLRETTGSWVMWIPGAQRGRLLDVGCGSGEFLARMRDLGWQVLGVEPDPAAARTAAEHYGIEVVNATLDRAGLPERSLDVITMQHAIEHVPDPIATLAECRRLLAPGGRVVAVTPNSGGLGARAFGRHWRGWDPPRHVFHFTPDTLRECATRAGLRVQSVRTLSRMARYLWHSSKLLRRDRGGPDWLNDYSFRAWSPGAVSFWLLEYATARLRPVGEEILLVASRGS